MTEVIDSNETVVNRYRYTPFGQSMVKNESVYNPYQYTGRRYDEERGNYYYRARIYDQQQSRFLSNDPAGQGANLYAYVGNNPVNRRDPSGTVFGGPGGPPPRLIDGSGSDNPWNFKKTGCSGSYMYDTYGDCLDALGNTIPPSLSTHKTCQDKCYDKPKTYLWEESASAHVAERWFNGQVFKDCLKNSVKQMIVDTAKCIVTGLIASAMVCYLSAFAFVPCLWTGVKVTVQECAPGIKELTGETVKTIGQCTYDALAAT